MKKQSSTSCQTLGGSFRLKQTFKTPTWNKTLEKKYVNKGEVKQEFPE
jgi:hypothetical protein